VGNNAWENGSRQSYNAKLCDELFTGKIFATLKEAKALD
jgi:hypothetical protein